MEVPAWKNNKRKVDIMLVTVTYSTEAYKSARKYNVKMAYKKGKADKVFEYCEKDLSEEFIERNKKTFSCKRGGGYWIWKPYVVLKTLKQLQTGDYLFYCDSGAFVIKDLHILADFMEKEKEDLLIFDLEHKEKEYTKRDVFIELDCDEEKYTDSFQRCATYFMMKKTKKTEDFVEQWLAYVQNYELVSNEDNVLHRMPNYKEFKDNRHDQSIFSVLSKKDGFKSYQDISQYRYPRGRKERRMAKKQEKKRAAYPILVCIHRQKKADCTSAFREMILNSYPQLSRFLHYGYH